MIITVSYNNIPDFPAVQSYTRHCLKEIFHSIYMIRSCLWQLLEEKIAASLDFTWVQRFFLLTTVKDRIIHTHKRNARTIYSLSSFLFMCIPKFFQSNREFDSWILKKVIAGRIKPAFFMSNFLFYYVLVCDSVV